VPQVNLVVDDVAEQGRSQQLEIGAMKCSIKICFGYRDERMWGGGRGLAPLPCSLPPFLVAETCGSIHGENHDDCVDSSLSHGAGRAV
jgi:hypothetical protein